MKTFAEAFAARGLDDWDVAQAIKKLTAARKRAAMARPTFKGPNAADLRAWEKSGLAGAALAAAYVATYETANCLRHAPPVFIGAQAPVTAQATPAAPEPAAQAEAPPQQPQARRPARPRRTPAPRTKNPLDALLGAMHDAHLMQRETRRTRTPAHA